MKGDPWDDSALINAFDEAFREHKGMHERGGHHGKLEDGAGKPSSDTEEHRPFMVDETGLFKSSDALSTIDEAGKSSSLAYYTQLMNQYYQIEEQRQKILDQLHHQQTTTTEVSHNVYSCCPAPPPSHYQADDIPKTVMDAVNRALSLLKPSQDCDSSSVKINGEETSEEMGKKSESKTELSSVLNALYLAGFHTGKYLEEQGQLKRGQ